MYIRYLVSSDLSIVRTSIDDLRREKRGFGSDVNAMLDEEGVAEGDKGAEGNVEEEDDLGDFEISVVRVGADSPSTTKAALTKSDT